jgi:hypothetical protein
MQALALPAGYCCILAPAFCCCGISSPAAAVQPACVMWLLVQQQPAMHGILSPAAAVQPACAMWLLVQEQPAMHCLILLGTCRTPLVTARSAAASAVAEAGIPKHDTALSTFGGFDCCVCTDTAVIAVAMFTWLLTCTPVRVSTSLHKQKTPRDPHHPAWAHWAPPVYVDVVYH